MPNFNTNYSGFSQGNQVVLEDLRKALQAGSGTDSSAFTGGRSLIPESLDRTLVNVLHNQDEARLFQMLKKVPVGSTVHEYTKRSEVGSDDGAWVAEGGTSFEKDQTLERRTVTMKFLQTLREVTLQMASADSIEDAEALEAEAGTLWLIRNIERIMWGGDSAVVAEEPDGLRKLISSENVIDLRGLAANTSNFEDAIIRGTRIIRDNFGRADSLFAPTMVFEDIQKLLRNRIRVPATNIVSNSGNYVFDTYPTSFGRLKLMDDIFISPNLTHTASTITAQRPGQPVITLGKTANATGSQFVTADAGTYTYAIAGVNRYGESQLSATQTQAVVAGDSVTITIGTASTNATGYHVYRSKPGETTLSFLRRVEGGPLPTTIVDLNADLPGTYDAFILTMDPKYRAIEWNQFLPMMKFQLYPTNAAVYPFLMLLFGALNVKKEEHMVRIKNISYSDNAYY